MTKTKARQAPASETRVEVVTELEIGADVAEAIAATITAAPSAQSAALPATPVRAAPQRSMPVAPPPVPVWAAPATEGCPYPAEIPLERRACPWERCRLPDGRPIYRCATCGAERPR